MLIGKKTLLSIFALLTCLFFSNARAQNECAVELKKINKNTNVPLAQCIEYFFDTESKTTAESIVQGQQEKFENSNEIPNQGYATGKYWFRLKITPESDKDTDFFLSLGNALAGPTTIYHVLPDRTLKEIATTLPNKNIKNREPLRISDVTIKFKISEPIEHDILIEANAVAKNFKPRLRGNKSFEDRSAAELIIFGMYFGIIFIMVLYNLWIYFGVKGKSYLYYAATILFLHGLTFTTLVGGTKLILPNSPAIAMRHLPFSSNLGFIFAILFSLTFLNAKDSHPRASLLAKSIIIVLPLQFIQSFFDIQSSIAAIRNFHLVFILGVVIYIAIEKALQGDRPARIFLVAWSILASAWMGFMGVGFGLFQHNFFTREGLILGSTIEIILFSIALADKINNLRTEKENAFKREAESAAQKALMESELQAARSVQETLLPEVNTFHNPYFELESFYHSCNEVGGDWFWYSSNEKTGDIFIYVGDVNGHGIPSALMTGVVCGSVSSLEPEMISHSEKKHLEYTAAILNDVILKTGTRSKRLVTMNLICINPNTGVLSYINAGHPFPMIWNNDQKSFVSLVGTNPSFGTPGATFKVHTHKLQPGDILFMYTDGFREAQDLAKSDHNQPRKKEMLELFGGFDTAQALKERISDRLSAAFVGNEKVKDDVTYVLVKWIQKRAIRKAG